MKADNRLDASAKPAPPSKGSVFRTIKAVAWGFFGVRQESAYAEDIARLTPLHILVVGLVGGILLVVGLVVLVKFVVAA